MSKVAIQGNASGTGTLTIAAPNTSTDRTLTLPDEAGTVLTSASTTVLPKGVPAFRVYLYNGGSNYSISNGVFTKIPFDTEDFDTNSFFDNTTNYRFQPTIAGYYQVTVSAYLSYTTTAGIASYAVIFKNGVAYSRGGQIQASGIYGFVNITDVVYLNGSTDYVEGYCFYTSTGSVIAYSSNANSTFMSGVLVRAD